MGRLKQKISSAQRALDTLLEALNLEDVSVIARDASIQRFEYTFEAVWKAAKMFLREAEGLDIGSPKGVIRSCMQVGIFGDEEAMQALEMVDDRNLVSHTYNEGLSEQIYSRLGSYSLLLERWLKRIQERLGQDTR